MPKPAPKPKEPKDVETLKREDAWQRTFSPSGVFVAAVFSLINFAVDILYSVLNPRIRIS